ncbi:MAG: TMAO reductase system periplasmic protein TorT [bacterium]|nr:TMAO reductase system periplasmic protein TorT [bacterium]
MKMPENIKKKCTVLLGILILTCASCTKDKPEGKPFLVPVEVWNRPFDMDSPRTEKNYIPLRKVSKKWNICVFFPHMKDHYWLAVNYGVADESKKLGIGMRLFHAGGYNNLDIQVNQVKEHATSGVDGVVIAAISYDGLNEIVSELHKKKIPVIDLVNGMSTTRVSAKSLVSFSEMGMKAGEYITKLHPVGGKKITIAWFPGPENAGWVKAGDQGFKKAISGSVIEIAATRYGDTGKKTQQKLVEEVLDRHTNISYIVGTAVTAETSVSILRNRGLSKKIKIIAYYFTPGVYRGIKRGTILAAPTDSAVIQGRIAIDQIVRILEKKKYSKQVGPKIYIVDQNNINSFNRETSLAPGGFRPNYTVNMELVK